MLQISFVRANPSYLTISRCFLNYMPQIKYLCQQLSDLFNFFGLLMKGFYMKSSSLKFRIYEKKKFILDSLVFKDYQL